MALAADQCRDARGIALVDDLARDILYAFRTFRRAPLAALTIVATVALGLGLVAAVFAVYNMIFLRVDAVRSPDELFAVERQAGPDADARLPFTRSDYDAMRRETSVFTDAVAMLRPVGTRMEGRPASSTLVTGNFFQVLRLHPQQTGSPGAPLPPSRTSSVVGVARDPAGRNRSSYLFTFRGVYIPTSSESRETSLMLQVHGDPDQVRQALLGPLTSIDPDVAIVTLRYIAKLQTYMLQLAFWLTVVLGGLALVLTVSGLFSVLSHVVEQQAKEIGVRMALGATTRNVVGLVLSQSLPPVGVGVVAGGSLAATLAIILMASPFASEIGDVVRVFDPLAYVASVLVITAACLLAVSVPALRAARIDPIATLRQD